MSYFDKMGRALQTALGLSAVLAFSNGCASAEDPAVDSGQWEDEPAYQAAADGRAITDTYKCTMGARTLPSALVVYEGGDCERVPLLIRGASGEHCINGCPSCWKLAEDTIQCKLLN